MLLLQHGVAAAHRTEIAEFAIRKRFFVSLLGFLLFAAIGVYVRKELFGYFTSHKHLFGEAVDIKGSTLYLTRTLVIEETMPNHI